MHAITIRMNQIEWETDRAYLIKIPDSNYKLWFPKKYTQFENSRQTKIRMLINSDNKYKIFKNGQGKYNNRKIVSEKEILSDELLYMFGYEEVQEDIIDDLLDD